MPKYYCDYCDTYLTHDSPSVRKTHCTGRKHKDNVKFYYQKWMEEQAQSLIDATTGMFIEFKCKLSILSTSNDNNWSSFALTELPPNNNRYCHIFSLLIEFCFVSL